MTETKLDPKEEQRYKRLRKLGKELHVPILEAFLMLEVFGKDGKLIQKHRQRSHSWTRNAYNMMFCQLAGKDADDVTFEAGKLSGKDTAGVVKNGNGPIAIAIRTEYSVDATPYGYLGAAADDTHGILVGSGENAESFEDYVLQTLIGSGSGAGELAYAESEAHSISYSDTTLANALVRYFNNNSGGNVDVNEVALVGVLGRPGIAASFYGLVSRDKLASTVTVPDTGQLKVTYTIELAYAA